MWDVGPKDRTRLPREGRADGSRLQQHSGRSWVLSQGQGRAGTDGAFGASRQDQARQQCDGQSTPEKWGLTRVGSASQPSSPAGRQARLLASC